MKIQIKVKPNARQSSLRQLDEGSWYAELKSSPVDDKANAELCTLLARQFGVSKSRIAIRSGATGRVKLIEIIDL